MITQTDALTDGNFGEGGHTAFAFTNPLFIDADGNGRFDLLGVSKLDLFRRSRVLFPWMRELLFSPFDITFCIDNST